MIDIPVVSGVILCPLCREAMTVVRSYVTMLRTARCMNLRCRNHYLDQELSLYTAPPPQPGGLP
jgi:uncharacterized CHY-type Zn-finger protein